MGYTGGTVVGDDAYEGTIVKEDGAYEEAMVEEDVAYVQRENGRGISDIFGAGGSILTTVMVLNARCLLEATGRKFNEFCSLVKKTEPKPDVIVVHEVNGYSGEMNIRGKIEGALRIYGVVFSPRLKQHAVARAGGGNYVPIQEKVVSCHDSAAPRRIRYYVTGWLCADFLFIATMPGCFAADCDGGIYPPTKERE